MTFRNHVYTHHYENDCSQLTVKRGNEPTVDGTSTSIDEFDTEYGAEEEDETNSSTLGQFCCCSLDFKNM